MVRSGPISKMPEGNRVAVKVGVLLIRILCILRNLDRSS